MAQDHLKLYDWLFILWLKPALALSHVNWARAPAPLTPWEMRDGVVFCAARGLASPAVWSPAPSPPKTDLFGGSNNLVLELAMGEEGHWSPAVLENWAPLVRLFEFSGNHALASRRGPRGVRASAIWPPRQTCGLHHLLDKLVTCSPTTTSEWLQSRSCMFLPSMGGRAWLSRLFGVLFDYLCLPLCLQVP